MCGLVLLRVSESKMATVRVILVPLIISRKKYNDGTIFSTITHQFDMGPPPPPPGARRTKMETCFLKSMFVPRSAGSLIDEAQEQPRSNAPLVELHAKLVTVLWIIMGLEMKSVKPLSLFNTTVIMLCFKLRSRCRIQLRVSLLVRLRFGEYVTS